MDYRKTCDMESRRILSDVNSVICDFTEKKKNRFDKEYIWNYTRNRNFKLSGRSELVCHIFKCGTRRLNLHSDRAGTCLDDGWRQQYTEESGKILPGTLSKVLGRTGSGGMDDFPF